jgi:hypothetical protein
MSYHFTYDLSKWTDLLRSAIFLNGFTFSSAICEAGEVAVSWCRPFNEEPEELIQYATVRQL